MATPHERHLAVEATDEDGRQVDREVLDAAVESVEDVALPDLVHQAQARDLLLQFVEPLEIALELVRLRDEGVGRGAALSPHPPSAGSPSAVWRCA